ncbi:MAG: hypothetical protein ACNA8W_25685, partial [Bradymonadaceae bacterium]
MKKDQSNRQKKKIIDQGVRELKARPGWDVSTFEPESPYEKLMQLDQETRDAKAFSKAEACS